jgi:K+ transporter
MNSHVKHLTFAGMIVTLGIIFGDIGTSPLYVFQTLLVEGGKVNPTWFWAPSPAFLDTHPANHL